MTWLSELVQQHSELESPVSFWWWSGLCSISAVVKDQVWLDRGGAYKLYPNIYVMLHADSALKKGPPVGLAKDLVRRVNGINIISGRSSIQGILKDLDASGGHTIPGGKIVAKKSIAFIVASEFSSSLVSDPAALTILTDLYDRHWNEGEYRSLLKMESFSLKDPTITMLVATNEAHFEDFIQGKDMHGGFIGRMFVIEESEVHTLNPLIKKLTVVPNRDKLAEYLKVVTTLKGPFADLDKTPAGKLYEEWYYKFYGEIKSSGIKDKTGTIGRFGDSVLKVAMLLSLSDSPDLIIKESHIQEAIERCEKLLGGVRKVTHGRKGISQTSPLKWIIIRELFDRQDHKISRVMLMKKTWMHYSTANEFDDLMISLKEAGTIEIEMIGNTAIYIMPDNQVEEYKHFFEGKNK